METKNPHEGIEGKPKPDEEIEFFAWDRAKELERRKLLPEEEVERLEKGELKLAKRMNSYYKPNQANERPQEGADNNSHYQEQAT